MTTDHYDKLKKEFMEYFCDAKVRKRWLRIIASTGSIYGKVGDIGENLLYLKPSLVWEQLKDKEKFNLEEKIPTIISLSSIHGVQPITQNSIDFLVSKKDKTTGFGSK